jgi:hypothetical protein
MKRVVFFSALLTLIAAVFSLCSKGPYAAMRRHFMYPDATLIVESGSTKKTIPIVGTSFRTRNGSSVVRYAGGYTFDTGPVVSWEFVGKTSHGDVYLVEIQRRDMKKEEVTPVLFKGLAQELGQFGDWRVEILSERPREQR